MLYRASRKRKKICNSNSRGTSVRRKKKWVDRRPLSRRFGSLHLARLTRMVTHSSLVKMRFFRPGIVAALTVALAAYAVDCTAATPQQATQCCHSMRCSSHGHHGMGCCKTMPEMRASLGQPLSAQGVSLTQVAFGVIEAPPISGSLGLSGPAAVAHSHAPPGNYSPPLLALRI